MAKKKFPTRHKQPLKTSTSGGDLIEQINQLSVEDLSLLHKSLPVLIEGRVEQQLRSTSVEEVLKANSFIAEQKKNPSSIKAVFFDPNSATSGNMFKQTTGGVSFGTLQRMGDIFIVRAIINTRIEQIQNFLKFSNDEQKEGFTIRRKKSIWGGDSKDLDDTDKREIERIVRFLEMGGENNKWDNPDTLQEFVRKIIKDSLTLDQIAFEISRKRSFELNKFRAIDASMIRYLDSVDPRYKDWFEQYRYMGYLPRYGMVWNGEIVRNPVSRQLVMFYPWELGFGIRNASTNILKNGYGTSELEILVEVMTWLLWGMQYNGNFFKQGSQPKGFINIKDQNMSNSTLNEFRQAWTQTMMGVQNSHRTPILSGVDISWIDLQKGNRDMEFNEWLKFLFVIVCSVYRIDPSELGFNFESSRIFGQDGQRERLEHSRQKGLEPLLIFLQNILNKYIIEELNPDYEFVFTGIEVNDESKQVDLDSRKLQNGMVSFQDIFQKYSGREYRPDDIILNPVFQQAQQQKMYGGEGMNSTVDVLTGEPEMGVQKPQFDPNINPIEALQSEGNPILDKALDYINQQWGV